MNLSMSPKRINSAGFVKAPIPQNRIRKATMEEDVLDDERRVTNIQDINRTLESISEASYKNENTPYMFGEDSDTNNNNRQSSALMN